MKFKPIKNLVSIIILSFIFTAGTNASADEKPCPDGFVAWHSYSDYSAMDSNLMVMDSHGEITEIKGNFANQMNADFGEMPYDIVFMAIDAMYDEWDIYRYNFITKKCINLTEKSGFRNEDPKFSPDGTTIVFKRGYWNSKYNDFVYDLYEMDVYGKNIQRLTNTPEEESMPYYSNDGKSIWYACSSDKNSEIFRLNTADGTTEKIFSGKCAYYPIAASNGLYFSGWWSAENRNDCIRRLSGEGTITVMPFCNPEYNCSDPCPTGESSMIFSSSENESYDLWFWNGTEKYELKGLNTEKHELGAAFFSKADFLQSLDKMTQYFFGNVQASQTYDINEDNNINILDYCLACSMK